MLSRYFLKSEKNSRSNIIEYTPMIGICKRYPLKEIKPLLLYYLLMRSQVLRTLTKMIYELYGTKNKEHVLERVLESVKSRYDFVLIDCPPSLGTLSIR